MDNNQKAQQVKDLQVQLDNVVSEVDKQIEDAKLAMSLTRELALVKTKLDEAEMWLNKHFKNVSAHSS